jgi:hypothetical protein
MRQLSSVIKKMLEDKALQALVDSRAIQANSISPEVAFQHAVDLAVLPGSAVPTTDTYTSDQILVHSSHFEDFFDRSRVRLQELENRPVMQSSQVITRLSNWVAGEPGILWLQGPFQAGDGISSPVAPLAAKMIELANELKVPLMSYFCHLPRRQSLRPGNSTQQAQASVALITALARQAMELLLPVFESDLNLSEVRLSLNTGTMASMPETLRLLADVLRILDRQVLCIIDGVHWLDDRSTDDIVADLIEVLRRSKAKILFTTSRRASSLTRSLGRTETITINMPSFSLSHTSLSERTL